MRSWYYIDLITLITLGVLFRDLDLEDLTLLKKNSPKWHETDSNHDCSVVTIENIISIESSERRNENKRKHKRNVNNNESLACLLVEPDHDPISWDSHLNKIV